MPVYCTGTFPLRQNLSNPPYGERGVGASVARAARWGRIENYMAQVNDSLCLLVQVESKTALDNLDEILDVEGIDGVFIGPADLSASLGYPDNAGIDILVVDSVAALTPKKEIEGDMGDSSVGLQARLMSQALRKLTGTISKTNTCCIFINQLREKIGVMFGSPETTTGGNALKFYSSVRLDIRRISSIKNGDQVIGNQVRVKVVKNKVAPPFRKTEFDIMFGEGISKAGEIIDLGVTYNIIKKSGSWFSYKDTRLAQGRDATKRLLQDNPELCEELEALIMQAITNPSEEQKVAASTASKTNVGDSIEGSEA